MADAKVELQTQQAALKSDMAARIGKLLADADAEVRSIASAAEADAAENLRRRKLVASLEARKNSLSSRREVLETAFSAAYDKLCSLDDEGYAELITAIAANSGAGGSEQVFLPSGMGERFTRLGLLERINSALGGSMTLGGESAEIRSGMLLCGKITDIDCSFESILSAWREQHEAEVAALLFESGV